MRVFRPEARTRNESDFLVGILATSGCTIDRSGYSLIDLSISTHVGTRKMVNYA